MARSTMLEIFLIIFAIHISADAQHPHLQTAAPLSHRDIWINLLQQENNFSYLDGLKYFFVNNSDFVNKFDSQFLKEMRAETEKRMQKVKFNEEQRAVVQGRATPKVWNSLYGDYLQVLQHWDRLVQEKQFKAAIQEREASTGLLPLTGYKPYQPMTVEDVFGKNTLLDRNDSPTSFMGARRDALTLISYVENQVSRSDASLKKLNEILQEIGFSYSTQVALGREYRSEFQQNRRVQVYTSLNREEVTGFLYRLARDISTSENWSIFDDQPDAKPQVDLISSKINIAMKLARLMAAADPGTDPTQFAMHNTARRLIHAYGLARQSKNFVAACQELF